MPYLTVNGCDHFYTDTGTPDSRPDAETVVFGHGFLMTHHLFERQVDHLRGRYRCVAFDWRGQGRSQVTSSGYGLRNLANDAAAFIEQLGVGPCHYVGHSMGGYVGFRLGLRRPDLLTSLALLDTQAGAEPMAKRLQYYLMLAFVRLLGYHQVVTDRVLPIMFGPSFRNDPQQQDALERWREIITANDRRGIFRTGVSIFSRKDILDRIGGIGVPTLLLVGADDIATPPATARAAHARLPHATLKMIPESGHSSTIEQPEAVNDALDGFWEGR